MIFVYSCYNLFNGIHIQQSYQVKTEAVDVILVCPVIHRIHNILANHITLGSGIIATTGGIRIHAGEISRYNLVEAKLIRIIYMVIYHIHDNTNLVLMQGIYHLFHFCHTSGSIIRICGIRTFRCIVIYRIIAPVKLWFSQFGLIHRAIVIYRQQMQMGNSQTG